ncbi:MAG: integrase core domain-containing protein, partial [Candidatus Acetothermia bacterium]|nr:integrase core domain-containing protein [Candidatus Acetothermia bacterium]
RQPLHELAGDELRRIPFRKQSGQRRSMPSGQVKAALARLFAERDPPEYIRSDNGPEFIAGELMEWLTEKGVRTHHIAPGSPWQNAYGESFNAALRRECLNQELFHGILDAKAKTGLWRRRYNRERPHSALGYRTPEEFRDGDVQVDADQNKAALEEAISRAGNRDVTVVVLPEANHLFQKAVTGGLEEYALLPMEFHPRLLPAIVDWLLARVGPGAR